jgi:hypothetical protein
MLSPFGELKDCVVIVEKMTQKSKVRETFAAPWEQLTFCVLDGQHTPDWQHSTACEQYGVHVHVHSCSEAASRAAVQQQVSAMLSQH